ncbi:hypothetical protein AB836_00355 [Rickettsiales bacterium (ex Bugula neritina AB1)]|nr:hypothetical protein AB836_00355 [Rickettsiales bacterium (ex Bugula neritina AB1)]
MKENCFLFLLFNCFIIYTSNNEYNKINNPYSSGLTSDSGKNLSEKFDNIYLKYCIILLCISISCIKVTFLIKLLNFLLYKITNIEFINNSYLPKTKTLLMVLLVIISVPTVILGILGILLVKNL